MAAGIPKLPLCGFFKISCEALQPIFVMVVEVYSTEDTKIPGLCGTVAKFITWDGSEVVTEVG
eukprot:658824-Pelagomonas_calceolata.AAC.1